MRTIMHTGVSLAYLKGLIQERGNRGFVESEGVALTDAEAISWCGTEIAAGRTYSTNCPTPRANGKCPGHPKS